MATGVNLFLSTDASAPVLTGQTGKLTDLLYACLVTGYGSISPAGSAGAGAWTRSFTGTSKAVFRPSAGNRFYWRVQDDGPGAGTFKEARTFAYESVTDVDGGGASGPFPTIAQASTGLVIRKSVTADSTARAWACLADDRTCYLFVLTGDTANTYHGTMFGDFCSELNTDAYRTMLIAQAVENSGTTASDVFAITGTSLNGTALAGHYAARGYTGLGGSLLMQAIQDLGKGIANSVGTVIPLPNGPNQAVYICPFTLGDGTTGNLRGVLRGIYGWGHQITGVADRDTLPGAGLYADKSLALLKQTCTSGIIVVETSDTWSTN